MDIYPPLEDEIITKDVLNSAQWHSFNFFKTASNSELNPSDAEQILIPLPKNVLPKHYDLQVIIILNICLLLYLKLEIEKSIARQEREWVYSYK